MARHPEGSEPSRAPERMSDRFNRYAARITDILGSFGALVWSVLLVVIWALTGPIFNFSDTWQLFINTSTTVITFWMVFVIQNSANRDAKAIHLKLDELIRGVKGARTEMVALETCTDEELAAFQKEFERLHERLSTRAAVAAHAAKILRHGPAAGGVAE